MCDPCRKLPHRCQSLLLLYGFLFLPLFCDISDDPLENVTNQFEARVSSVTYLGDVEEYWLNVRDSSRMQVMFYHPGSYERKAGDKVYIQFQPQDVVPLSAANS